jgi:hypothetical protein
MTSQQHETIAALISGLNIKRYQDLLDTPLDEAKRQAILTLLREEVWMKTHTPPFSTAPVSSQSYESTTHGMLGLLRQQHISGARKDASYGY